MLAVRMSTTPTQVFAWNARLESIKVKHTKRVASKLQLAPLPPKVLEYLVNAPRGTIKVAPACRVVILVLAVKYNGRAGVQWPAPLAQWANIMMDHRTHASSVWVMSSNMARFELDAHRVLQTVSTMEVRTHVKLVPEAMWLSTPRPGQ